MASPKNAAPPWRRDFTWGVSSSSFQIEGAAREDGRGPSIWDTFCASGRIANHETGDTACDHYHRYAEDVALMRDLGVQAYRFSVAWPRVLPHGRGAVNELGLDFYDRLIDTLLAAGIEPWLCLYHWDLPQSLADLGGWIVRDAAGWFADYASLVGKRYGDRVRRVATFNEPAVFTLFGYGFGDSAPGASGADTLNRAIHNVNLAHGAAVDVLRSLVPNASIGIIHNVQPCLPATAADTQAADLLDAYWNGAFPNPQCLGYYPPQLTSAIEPYSQPGDLARICRRIDWFGLNHYSPIYAKGDPRSSLRFGLGAAPEDLPHTPIGWPTDAGAFQETLLKVGTQYRLPIYVLENGFGGYDAPDSFGRIVDTPRIDFLSAYVDAMRAAIAKGADVRGYFVWSLLDNFEWTQGYRVRFGLVYIDYVTQKRTPKASFSWYADLIRAAGQTDHLETSHAA